MQAAFTIVTRNHLHRARLVMEDVARHCPDCHRYVFLADDPGGLFDPRAEPFHVIPPESYGPPRLRHLAFALGAYGLCCLLKPWAAARLRELHPGARLLYLDSDTTLLSSPADLFEAAGIHDIVLLPHVVCPALNSPGSWITMQSGALNGGLFALGPGRAAGEFLGWWAANMSEPDRVQPGWLYDQGWLAQVPGLFPECQLFRDPGYNVAFWNLHERPVARDPRSGALTAGGRPLVHLHLSHFDRARPRLLAGRIQAPLPPPPPELVPVLEDYAARLVRHGADSCESWVCEYNVFSDGRAVSEVHRRHFTRRFWNLLPPGADPFDAGLRVPGAGGLKSLRNANHPVTRLLRALRGS